MNGKTLRVFEVGIFDGEEMSRPFNIIVYGQDSQFFWTGVNMRRILERRGLDTKRFMCSPFAIRELQPHQKGPVE